MAAFTADGSLPQETLDQLKARIKVPEISVVETVVAAAPPKAAPGTPKAGAFVPKAIIGAPKAAGGTTPNVPPAKRKMDDAAAAVADKKARLKDPAELRVYLELEIMRNSKVSAGSTYLAASVTEDPGPVFFHPGSGSASKNSSIFVFKLMEI